MSIFSLNLDHADATIVRRALRRALAACDCAAHRDRGQCANCESLLGIADQLEDMINRPMAVRSPVLSLLALEKPARTPAELTPRSDGSPVERLRLIVHEQSHTGR